MSNIYAVLLAVIPACINVGILLYLVLAFPKTKLVRLFAGVLLAILLWQLEDAGSRLVSTEEEARYIDRLFSIGWLMLAPMLLRFTLFYTSRDRVIRKIPDVLIYLPFIVFYVLYLANLNPVRFQYHSFWGWVIQARPNSLDVLQRICIAGTIVLSLGILLRYLLQQKLSKRKRMQAMVLALGVLVPTVQGTTTQVLFTMYGNEIPVTSSFLTLFSLSALVALKKYRLFELGEVISTEEVMDHINNVIMIVSPEGHIVFANSFARDKLGLNIEETDYHISKIFNPFQRAVFDKNLLDKIQSGEIIGEFEAQMIDARGGMFDVIITSEIIMLNGKTGGVLLIANDVTETKLQKRTIDFQLGQMQQIAYIQSHIVRAPLTRIMGISDILKHDEDLTEAERKTFLGYLESSVHDLDNELRDIVNKTQDKGLQKSS